MVELLSLSPEHFAKMTKKSRVLRAVKAVSQRIVFSLCPPVTRTTSKIDLDVFGPLLVLSTLWLLLELGRPGGGNLPPIIALILFHILVPSLVFAILKAGQSSITLWQVVGLVAYAQFGHFCTLGSTLLLRSPRSHAVFFTSLIIFGGLSAVRLVLLLSFSLRKPVLTLLAGCLACIPYLLFIIFTYFSYIPPLK